MSVAGPRYSFERSPGAADDFSDVRVRSVEDAAEIAVQIEEIAGWPDHILAIAEGDAYDDIIEDVVPVHTLERRGLINLRVKFREIRNWRLIFGVDNRPRYRRVVLLAIMPREEDYRNEVRWARVEKEYDDCGLRRLS